MTAFAVGDYGAVGNGIADDSGAIQDTIDAAIADGSLSVMRRVFWYALVSASNTFIRARPG